MSKRSVGLKIGLALVATIGMVQASLITKTMAVTDLKTQNNITWQNIQSVTYTWDDLDGDNAINTEDKVTFDIVMHKTQWGTHDYDVLKVWVGDEVINAPVTRNQLTELKSTGYKFIWDYSGTGNVSVPSGQDLNKFSFDYVFKTAGDYDLTASVMCSRDLSGLSSQYPGYTNVSERWNDKPTVFDFNAWDKDIHNDGTFGAPWKDRNGKWNPSYLQGETKKYELSVVTRNVPEPSSFSLIFLGLASLAGSLFIRRKK